MIPDMKTLAGLWFSATTRAMVLALSATLAFTGAAFADKPSAGVPAVSVPAVRVPLVTGLTLISAASERQGDYESTLTVDAIDADGMLHLTASADLPDPAGGKPKPVSFNRDVSAADRGEARTYKYLFSVGADEYPGTTAMGTSSAVIADLRATGKAAITLDGQLGGLGGMLSGLMGMIPGAESTAAPAYLSAAGTVAVVGSNPESYPMILNDAPVSLPAWHLKGTFTQNDTSVPVEWYLLDDPANALTLRFAFGKDRLEITRISYPVDNPANTLEASLAKERRAVTYGIYFDFNSATIKPQSDATLRAIVEVMNKNPEWNLNIEGHTDNIGGDVKNQELSARRAAAVRAALQQRGIADTRLTAAGFGASVPRASNTTLAGRARNRRVELSRQ